VGKLRAQKYPTEEFKGIVFVWMGETEPVPIEEDIPWYFNDPDVIVETYVRRWDMNWSLTVENSHDSHAVKIHRGSLRRLWTRGLFNKSAGYHGGMRIAKEGENFIHISATHDAQAGQQGFYPALNSNWPKHVWWKFRGGRRGKTGKTFDPDRPGYTGLYQLPAWVSPSAAGDRCHLRCAVPISENVVRMWTFTLTRHSFWPGWINRLRWKLDYHLRHVYQLPQGTNEMEDMPVQSVGCLDPDLPQKIGASDVGLIFWRRRMPLKSRDAQLVWSKKQREEQEQAVVAAEESELEPVPEQTPAG
jgi:phenylpropionate dioxygenase-like ring-hydroxylating dioxygenase large terminal subunit